MLSKCNLDKKQIKRSKAPTPKLIQSKPYPLPPKFGMSEVTHPQNRIILPHSFLLVTKVNPRPPKQALLLLGKLRRLPYNNKQTVFGWLSSLKYPRKTLKSSWTHSLILLEKPWKCSWNFLESLLKPIFINRHKKLVKKLCNLLGGRSWNDYIELQGGGWVVYMYRFQKRIT